MAGSDTRKLRELLTRLEEELDEEPSKGKGILFVRAVCSARFAASVFNPST